MQAVHRVRERKAVCGGGAVAALILLLAATPGSAQVALLDACFTVAPEPIAARTSVTFDGGCSRSNLGGRVTSHTWNFGDGSTATGAVVEHAYAVGGQYRAALTVRDDLGNTASVDRAVTVIETILPFEDGFERAPGADVGDWTVFSGSWFITAEGQLRGRSFGESHIYAGRPSGLIAGDVTIELNVEFLNTPLDGDGRHAGVFLYAREPASRWSTAAYSVSWTDRAGVAGLALHRWSGGNVEPLAISQVAAVLHDPPRAWRITVEGARIRVHGDGALLIDVEDDQLPREGHVGLWTYSNDQDVLFDNFTVRSGAASPAIIPCAEADADPALVGQAVTLDATCSEIPEGVEATAYRWSFGDGTTGSGPVVDHTYGTRGRYVVELTIEHDGGSPVTTSLALSVAAPAALPYSDDFDQPAGPGVEGWTVSSGAWSITDDERLQVSTSVSEAYIWIGDPPMWFDGDLTMEFEIEFEGRGPLVDGIGRHAGVFFYAKESTARSRNEAYDVWWIDRDQDYGLGLHEWPLRFLSPGTFDKMAAPPTSWRVEVSGSKIRVFGDDEMLIDADDDTRRGGYIGFWAYSNDQVVRFDNLCIVQGPVAGKPDCGSGPPPPPPPPPRSRDFVRGDTNGDGSVDITDGIFALLFLFGGGVSSCLDAMDGNDDGQVNIADGIFLLNFLFGSGGEPTAPWMNCGTDPTADGLSCRQFDRCS